MNKKNIHVELSAVFAETTEKIHYNRSFESVNWSTIHPDKLTMSFEPQKGYVAHIWLNRAGEANNKILHSVIMSESLNKAFTKLQMSNARI